MSLYLADTSVWSWAENSPGSALARKLASRVEAGDIVTSAVVLLEMLHLARNGAEYELLYGRLDALPRVGMSSASAERAVAVQRQLAQRTGSHRRPAADFLLAAAAEEAGPDVVLWFYDKDLKIICEHTGQPFEAESRA